MSQEEKDKRNGRISAVLFTVLMLVWLIFFGFSYQDPPPEEGIAINFGYDNVGSGNTSSSQQTEEVTQPQETQPEAVTQTSEQTVATQESVDAPAINTEETKPQETQEEPEPDPQPSDRLSRLTQSVRDGQGTGEGEDETGGGDQGDPKGDPNSDNRTGTGGSGGGGDYMLGGRAATQRPRPEYDCTDEGTVVVKVYVDRTGRVLRAVPGEAITGGAATNTFSSCLFNEARDTALRTKWQGDPNAPEEQVGYIVYRFKKN